MSKVFWKPTTLIGPVPPALVTSSCGGRQNVLTVAWTGIINSKPAMTYVSIKKERFSHDLILNSGEFAVNFANAKLLRAVDLCGVKSGREQNKFELANITPIVPDGFNVPIVGEAPISLMCRVKNVVELPSHDMFIAEITGVFVEDSLLDAGGALKIERADLIGFAHGQYFTLGKRLASFGYSVKKRGKK